MEEGGQIDHLFPEPRKRGVHTMYTLRQLVALLAGVSNMVTAGVPSTSHPLLPLQALQRYTRGLSSSISSSDGMCMTHTPAHGHDDRSWNYPDPEEFCGDRRKRVSILLSVVPQ